MNPIAQHVFDAVSELSQRFTSAKPFRHVVIDNFFSSEVLPGIVADFPALKDRSEIKPKVGDKGNKATNHAVRTFGEMYRAVDDYIAGAQFRQLMETITGIQGLLYDPDYHGAGAHENFDGVRSFIHYDFNYHGLTSKHRRLNAIIYLTEGWREEWGGAISLHADGWRPDGGSMVRVPCLFNRCIIFETHEHSWHGVEPIVLPDEFKHITRKSFTIYMYSDSRPAEEIVPRHSTVHMPRPLPAALLDEAVKRDPRLRQLKTYIDRQTALLRQLYDKEKKFSRQLGALRAENQRRHQHYRLPLIGWAEGQSHWGIDKCNDWVVGSFGFMVRALRPLSRVSLEGVYPEGYPIPMRVRMQTEGRAEETVVRQTGLFNATLELGAVAAEACITVRVESDQVLSPRELGVSQSPEKLSFKLQRIILE